MGLLIMELIGCGALCVVLIVVASWCSKILQDASHTQFKKHLGILLRGIEIVILVVALVAGIVWYGSQPLMYTQMKESLEAGDYAGVHERYHSRLWHNGRWEPSYWDAYSEWKMACESNQPLSSKKLDAAVALMRDNMTYEDGEWKDRNSDDSDPSVIAISEELDSLCRPPYEEGIRLMETGAYEDAARVLDTVSYYYANRPYLLEVAQYMTVYPDKVRRYQGYVTENFKLLKNQYQPTLTQREQNIIDACTKRLSEEANALKKVLQAESEANRKAQQQEIQRMKEEAQNAMRKKYPYLSQSDIKDCEDIMKYPHKGMLETSIHNTPLGYGHIWNVGQSNRKDVDCYTFKNGGKTICYAYVQGGVVTNVNVFQQICGFSITHAEQILNGQRNPYDLLNEINGNSKVNKNKQKNGTTSGSSSSSSNAHGFAGSEDEWEDYDDYMDDYDYWEHRDVDDEDDWEDDWDEDE